MRELIFFLLGAMLGGFTGVCSMCFFQINRESREEREESSSDDYGKPC